MTTIRKAKIKDVSNISVLALELLKYHEKYDSYFAPAKNAKEVYEKYFFKCIYSPMKQLLVAESNGEIAGYALIELTSRPPVFIVKNMGLINDMYVVEKFRRKGIAKQLLTELLNWIKSKKSKYPDLDYVELSVNIKDMISQNAWAKYGFKEYMSKQRMKI